MVRDAVGPDVDLMLDNHGRFPPFFAIELMHALQSFNMLFLEELVPPEKIGQVVALNSSTFHGSRMVGPAIAGAIIATLGFSAAG